MVWEPFFQYMEQLSTGHPNSFSFSPELALVHTVPFPTCGSCFSLSLYFSFWHRFMSYFGTNEAAIKFGDFLFMAFWFFSCILSGSFVAILFCHSIAASFFFSSFTAPLFQLLVFTTLRYASTSTDSMHWMFIGWKLENSPFFTTFCVELLDISKLKNAKHTVWSLWLVILGWWLECYVTTVLLLMWWMCVIHGELVE